MAEAPIVFTTTQPNRWLRRERHRPRRAAHQASTVATEGEPGSFNDEVPADLTELGNLGALGNSGAWATDAYVTLEDGSLAHWDGAAWQSGAAP